ncbi:heat shock protein HslJ [Methylorubrum rhodinum]|uniref:Heat shock protein HslJ n=1 Tax=Methylorubrum rhodinum TaxID=29428 RepID=A0A840ZFW3_9HYPH|nr:META domain-containing protein [Methylorubrum rhodinum]MBB5756180.1 heat shock protein HslJ [Methylorubrum rhodinum]
MNRKLTAALAGVVAVAALAAGPTLAQGTNQITGFGQGGRTQEKKPQYVPGAKAQEKMFPLGATWTAVSLNGKPFNGNDRPTFIIDSQYRARGYGGCNTFTATAFPLREQHLAVGPLAITKKSCDKGLAATEQAFLIALRTSGAWDLVGSQLVIRTQNGELRFDRTL